MECLHHRTEDVSGYKCLGSCEEFNPDEGGPVYECSVDGMTFTPDESPYENHQCPECNRFSAKTLEESCVTCKSEVEETVMLRCLSCDAFLEVETVG